MDVKRYFAGFGVDVSLIRRGLVDIALVFAICGSQVLTIILSFIVTLRHTHAHTCKYDHICTHIHTYTYAYTYTYALTHGHRDTDTHTHTDASLNYATSDQAVANLL